MKTLRCVLWAALASFATQSAVAQGFCFDAAVNYAAGGYPTSVFAADLDGDGDRDLAVANITYDNVSVLKNNGNGIFAAPVSYAVGNAPTSVIAADLDGDGDHDLAVCASTKTYVSVLKNNGNGTFAAAVNYVAGAGTECVSAADLDGDGDRDLAVANISGANVSVLKNNGNGTFAAAVNYAAGSGPEFVFAADLSGDGYPDLAVVNRASDNVSVLKNNGNGTFATAVNYAVGDFPHSVFAADLDGDVHLDLAVANYWADNVSVLKNNGNGTFAAAVNYAAGDSPRSVFAADLDGDVYLDLAVANFTSDDVSVLKNNGNGTFAAAVNYAAGNGPRSVFAADLDGDGDRDLAVASYFSGNVSVLINCASGAAPTYPHISTVLDAGTGSDLVVKWTQPNKTGVTDYWVYWGTTPGVYPDSAQRLEGGRPTDSMRIPGLVEHTPYYVAVRAHNANADLWSAPATWPTPVRPTVPVVLVHGFDSDKKIWDVANSTSDYLQWLQDAGFNYIWLVDNLEPCGAQNESQFEGNAQHLSKFIEDSVDVMLQRTGVEIREIDIIAHSMGGLIARSYISEPSMITTWARLRQVRHLIMLGTPNTGTELACDKWHHRCRPLCDDCPARLLCDDGPAWWEMSIGNMREFNFYHIDHHGTKFYAAAGWGGHEAEGDCDNVANCCSVQNSADKVYCAPYDGNDGVVSISSVRGDANLGLVAFKTGAWCHHHEKLGYCFVKNADGLGLAYYEDQSLVNSFILPILNGTAVSSQGPPELTATKTGAPGPQTFLHVCDSILTGGSTTATFAVESGSATISMYSTDTDLDLYLESPSHIVWDSAAAAASDVMFISDEGGKGFRFVNAEGGTWDAHINATAISGPYASYCLEGTVRNSIAVDATTSSNYALSGETMSVVASVADGGTPFVGADVRASAVDDTGHTLAEFVLRDDGVSGDGQVNDGIYGGSIVVARDSSIISFLITASGTSSSGPFSRRLSRSAYILPGSYGRGDMNYDGIYDVLDVVGLVGYVFRGEPPPHPDFIADTSCDGIADVLDVVRLVDHVFRGGPQPSC